MLDISFRDNTAHFPQFDNNKTLVPQPFLWICNLVNHMSAPYPDEIRLGYIFGDCFWMFSEHFIQAFESMFKMAHLSDNAPKLVFPLKMNKKYDLAYIIPKGVVWHKIQSMTWTCEYPLVNEETGMVSECGECDTCKRRVKPKGEMTFDILNMYDEIKCKEPATIDSEDISDDWLILQ